MSNLPVSEDSWKLQLDSEWDVLGPFPIHAREQHYLSPAFPLKLSEPIDYARSWPSSFADHGKVVWLKATMGHATLQISFPNIRWAALRRTEGWAALQHHTILRTTLTIFPPMKATGLPPRLLVDLKQGSYFTLRPQSEDMSTFVPEWYAGNIYDMERAIPHAVELPSKAISEPKKFDLFVSGDYEIRVFGDPLVGGGQIPVLQLGIHVSILSNNSLVLRHSTQDVCCDFVSGYAFGDCIGISLQSVSGWLTVNDVKVQGKTKGLSLILLQPEKIAPTQTRIIPIVISQQEAFFEQCITFDIVLESDGKLDLLSVVIRVKHHTGLGSQEKWTCIQGTYLYAGSMPTAFLAMPPKPDRSGPPILALHGAGVDIFYHDFWVKSMPEGQRGWTVIPTGRTSWGLDWHGPSASDAWSSLEALMIILEKATKSYLAESYKIPPGCKVVLIGHSNGGQGAWYMASRYPDRVLAAVPAAAYLKSQAYIPLALSRSAHFIDPSLRSILESSLTADDNDIHLSNMVDMPLMAIHGGEDTNVPVWHTREAVGLLKSLYPSQEIILKEDEGEGHWYPSVFKSPATYSFLENVASDSRNRPMAKSFTLTVITPAECGSLYGWRICQLKVPGRIGKLQVGLVAENSCVVETSNVRLFSLPMQPKPLALAVDGQIFHFGSLKEDVYIKCNDDGFWQLPTNRLRTPPPGRIQAVLSSEGPITIIVSGAEEKREFSLALRIAHVLHTYHRLDSAVITEYEALARTHSASWSSGNVVLIGKPSSLFVKHILDRGESPVKVVGSTVHISNRKFAKQDQAMIITHPHPCRQDSFMLLILYHDASGLERAGRLFPFRTGVAAPDWVVLGEHIDEIGAAGVDAAGVWGSEWNINEPMTWFSQ